MFLVFILNEINGSGLQSSQGVPYYNILATPVRLILCPLDTIERDFLDPSSEGNWGEPGMTRYI
jgi:hypothetical protein